MAITFLKKAIILAYSLATAFFYLQKKHPQLLEKISQGYIPSINGSKNKLKLEGTLDK